MTKAKPKFLLLTREEKQHRVALAILALGLATVSEVAQLRGVTRQYMQKFATETRAREKRQRYLKDLWTYTENRLG